MTLERGGLAEGFNGAEEEAAKAGRYGRPEMRITNNSYEFAPQVTFPAPQHHADKVFQSECELLRSVYSGSGPNDDPESCQPANAQQTHAVANSRTGLTAAQNELLERLYGSDSTTGISPAQYELLQRVYKNRHYRQHPLC